MADFVFINLPVKHYLLSYNREFHPSGWYIQNQCLSKVLRNNYLILLPGWQNNCEISSTHLSSQEIIAPLVFLRHLRELYTLVFYNIYLAF